MKRLISIFVILLVLVIYLLYILIKDEPIQELSEDIINEEIKVEEEIREPQNSSIKDKRKALKEIFK